MTSYFFPFVTSEFSYSPWIPFFIFNLFTLKKLWYGRPLIINAVALYCTAVFERSQLLWNMCSVLSYLIPILLQSRRNSPEFSIFGYCFNLQKSIRYGYVTFVSFPVKIWDISLKNIPNWSLISISEIKISDLDLNLGRSLVGMLFKSTILD